MKQKRGSLKKHLILEKEVKKKIKSTRTNTPDCYYSNWIKTGIKTFHTRPMVVHWYSVNCDGLQCKCTVSNSGLDKK